MILRLDLLANSILQQTRRDVHTRMTLRKGFYWSLLLSFTLLHLSSAFNAENNNIPSTEDRFKERESANFHARRLNHNNHRNNNQLELMQQHLGQFNNRLSLAVSPKRIINTHFMGPSSPTIFHHPHHHHQNHRHHHPKPPPGPNGRRGPNDLTSSAQTLYDLRGFHIPLGGQEETQRYLRQQNELEQQQRTKPLVFPSFFQPQSPSLQPYNLETAPQAINIFGHNQHHQQTNRFVLPVDDTTFRPSQPDLSLTTSTENVFKPVGRPATSQDQPLENNQYNRNENDNNIKKGLDDFVYVYDDLEYDDIEQDEAELEKGKSSSQIKSSSQGDGGSPSRVRSNQPTAVIETSTTTNALQTRHESPHHVSLNQNHFDVESQKQHSPNEHGNFFLKQDNPSFHASNPFNGHYDRPQILIESPRLPPQQQQQQRPRVEIVPSSERKPPPDQSNAINQNHRPRPGPMVYEDGHGRPSYEPQRHLTTTALGPQLTDYQPSTRFTPPPPPPQGVHHPNEIPYYNRNQNSNKLVHAQRPLVIGHGHEYDNQFRFRQPQDPIILQKFNPNSNRELLNPTQQPRLRPVNTVFPQHLGGDDSQGPDFRDQYFVEERPSEPELVEVFRQQITTEAPTPTTPSTTPPRTTTVKPFRRNPFPTRHRLLPTARTAGTTSTSTEAPTTVIPRRRIRPRLRTTSTSPAPELSENYIIVPEDEEQVEPVRQLGIVKAFESETPGFGGTSPESPLQSSTRERISHHHGGRQRITSTTTTTPSPTSPAAPFFRQKPQRQFFSEDVVGPHQLNIQENLVLENHGQGQREKPGQLPTFPEEFGVVHQQAHNNHGLNSFQDRGPPRQIQRRPPPPSPQVTAVQTVGKPLYLNAKDKEGGLYADYIIPIGHIYGSPIPFLPINQILDKMPGLFDGHSISPQLPRSTTAAESSKRGPSANNRVRSNSINPISISRHTATTTTTTASSPAQHFVSSTSGALESETNSELGDHGERIRPLRRRIKPRPTEATAPPRTTSEPRASYKPHHPSKTARPVPVPSVEVSPPATPKPNPLHRRPRPRIRLTPTTTSAAPAAVSSATTVESPEVDELPNPRPQRKLIKKQRPTRRSFRKPQPASETSDESVPQTSVKIFRKPTETPGRFSSRFRDETGPQPTNPAPIEIGEIPQQSLKSFKPTKKLRTTPAPLSSESVEVETKIKAVKKEQHSPEGQSGELPSSIFLKPTDVLTNRKPARRIPPGSASDKLKVLQEKRRNLLTNRFNPRRPVSTSAPAAAARKKLAPEPTDEDEDEDEDDDEYSDNEQVQNKREITQRNKGRAPDADAPNTLINNNTKYSSYKGFQLKAQVNSTGTNSEETATVLGIPRPISSSGEMSIPVPPLSIEKWFQDDEQGTTASSRQKYSGELALAASQRQDTSVSSSNFNRKLAQFLQSHPLYGRNVTTNNPFDVHTMSTNEPSLPLEAYFPIVSSHNSKELRLSDKDN